MVLLFVASLGMLAYGCAKSDDSGGDNNNNYNNNKVKIVIKKGKKKRKLEMLFASHVASLAALLRVRLLCWHN